MTGTVSSRRAYTGRIINLDVDTVQYPNGSIGDLEMVRHPGASAIIPVLGDPAASDPELLLIKQYRYAAEGYLYEIPAGRLEPNEAPVDCARRELREETGCTAEALRPLFTVYTTPGFTDERIHIFLATGLTRGATAHEADEFMTIETVRLSAALRLIESGALNDGKSAMAILYFSAFCRRASP
jgi:ADP-ribose pyrophosphatase